MVKVNLQTLTGATKTAIVAPIPEVEPVVGSYRRALDHTAAWPVPAHVTVLYPFVAPAQITQSVLDDVAAGVIRAALAVSRTAVRTMAGTGLFEDHEKCS